MFARLKKRVSKKPAPEKCPRCYGRGWVALIVGPHINELGAVPGGKIRYDCRMCCGTGRASATLGFDDV
jgi:hypothetical protein